MMKKILFALIALVVLNIALAQDYVLDKVEIDGATVLEDGLVVGSGAVFLERGSTADIEVFVKSLDGVDFEAIKDVKVKAWIGGYEYGDVEETSEIFDINAPNVVYKKTLRLDIPNDLDVDEGDYTLFVKVFDRTDSVEESFDVFLEEKRHLLKIQDVILRPTNVVDAGAPLFVVVRVENLGDKKEEDIRVSVSIPELGLSTRDYIDELAAHEIDNEDEEDSESSNEIFLRIPKDTASGLYTLKVDVEYDRGHKTVSKQETINVLGKEKEEVKKPAEAMVVVDSSSQSVRGGEEALYRLTLMNTGEEAELYSLEVSGEKLFASSRVDPGFVLIKGGESASFDVIVRANENADGIKNFVVKVKAGETIIKELPLSLEVTGRSYDLGTVLVAGFIVLIVVLIILGVVLLATKSRPEEPGSEGQSYY